MAPGFGSLEIARSGLYTNERGLFVTGHNLSNVNTQGYARQQAVITTANYYNSVNYQIGLGADIQQTRQIRHTFLDNVYRNESQTLGYWESRQKTFEDIQGILGEPMEAGLQNTMNEFWDSWQELSKDPGSLTVRALVMQRSTSLVQYVNHMDSQLDKLQWDLESEIKVRISEVNSLAANVADLNVKISAAEVAGDSANDLRDQRNVALDRLSKLIDCQIVGNTDGQVDVIVGGQFIATKGRHEEVTAVRNKGNSMFSAPAIHDGEILLDIKGGILKGLMESRGEVAYYNGSVENGSSRDSIDLVFAFNLNDTSAQMDSLMSSIEETVKTYTDKGFKVRLGYVGFDETGVSQPPVFSASLQQFVTDIGGMTFNGSGNVGGKAGQALRDAVTETMQADEDSGWINSTRQFVLMSDSPVDAADMISMTNVLNSGDVRLLALSTEANRGLFEPLAAFSRGSFFNSGASTAADTTDDVLAGDVLPESIRNGVYGDVQSSTDILPGLKQRLNILVSALTREVNNLHRSGMTLGLNSHPGDDFFVPIDSSRPMEMGNIMLNANLKDLNNIVASRDGSNGDNTVALEISDLRHLKVTGNIGDVLSLDEFYHSAIMMVGNGGSEALTAAQSQGNLVNSVDNQRQSIMNVSLDEEMSNMMKYQFAYGASARVLNVLDEMFESVINRLGAV